MKHAETDFNMLVRGGLVLVSQTFASEELHRGDPVTVADFADPGLCFEAVVDHIDDGLAYLKVYWDRPVCGL